jgi:hypothetical protein
MSGAPHGNQNARKGRVWSEAIRRALARYSGSTVEAGLDKLADKLVAAADAGDKDACALMERIGDRLEGKPALPLVGDEDHPPINGRVVLIKPNDG